MTLRDRAVLRTPDLKKSEPNTSKLKKPKRKLWLSLLLQTVAMIGVGVFVYSDAADWFARLNHNAEISGYTSSVRDADPQTLSEAKRVAQEFNANMPSGMLRDPYSNPSPKSDAAAGYAEYEQLLRLNNQQNVFGEATETVIGEVSYPKLAISLPIYHGADDATLKKGVGHIYGSSLPVGGPSTHSVMTSHSGLLHANLFTNLPKAELGDTFMVQSLGETLWYRVDDIVTVLPEETELLKIVENKDYVTLITCTPTGINSHRLLVRGERIDAPEINDELQAIAGDGKTAGIPWWAVIFFGASGTIAYLIFVPTRKARRSPNAKNSMHAETGAKL